MSRPHYRDIRHSPKVVMMVDMMARQSDEADIRRDIRLVRSVAWLGGIGSPVGRAKHEIAIGIDGSRGLVLALPGTTIDVLAFPSLVARPVRRRDAVPLP